MNIECIKDKLLYIISKTEKLTSKNITLPILSCILFEAKDSLLTIKATNLDVGIEIQLPVKVVKPGSIAVSGSILYNFISNITNDKNITLEAIDGNLKIKTLHSQSIIKSFETEDFPNIPKVSDGSSFAFNIPSLIKGLRSVIYSASTSTIRPVLGSVMLYSDEDNVVFVATDSFRLSEKRINVKKHKEFNQILIPFKNVVEIIRTFEDYKDDVNINLNQNQITFLHNDIYITSRVIDGVFPDYKEIIPRDIKTEVIVLKQDFLSALRISNIFSDKFSQVTFHILPKEKIFKIATKNIDIGENINNLDAVIKGDELSISFNYKYIIDCF